MTFLFIVFAVLLIITILWFILLYTESNGEGRLAHKVRTRLDRWIERMGMKRSGFSLLKTLKVRDINSAGVRKSSRELVNKENKNPQATVPSKVGEKAEQENEEEVSTHLKELK